MMLIRSLIKTQTDNWLIFEIKANFIKILPSQRVCRTTKLNQTGSTKRAVSIISGSLIVSTYSLSQNCRDTLAGATNENIVKNHFKIAFLNVFQYLTVDIGIFLSPKNFSQKKGPRKFQVTFFRVKLRQKWAITPFFRCSKILGEAVKQEILQKMFRKFQISNCLPNRYFPKIDAGCPFFGLCGSPCPLNVDVQGLVTEQR